MILNVPFDKVKMCVSGVKRFLNFGTFFICSIIGEKFLSFMIAG